MKIISLALVGITAGLAGCVTQTREELAAEFRGIVVAPVSSASVTVRGPLLRQRAGRLELLGFVVKTYGAETTERTHLDVVFVGLGGEELRAQTTRFSPQRMITGRRAPNRQAHYLLSIEGMPPDTARIEVRAHDTEDHRS